MRAALSNAARLDTESAVFFLHSHGPGSTVDGFPIRAILLPRVTGRPETLLSPSSSGDALAALAPSTIFQLSRADHGAFQTMARCVRQVPCYRLDLGTDLSRIPNVILRVLSGEPAR